MMLKPGDVVHARPGTILRIVDGFVDYDWTVESVNVNQARPTAHLIDSDGNRRWEWVDGLVLA